MLIQHIIVEPSISNCETSKLPCISIWILAALNGSGDQSKLKQFLIKEPSMPTQITNKIAHLGSDASILVNDEDF